jgi:hypothetical protein
LIDLEGRYPGTVLYASPCLQNVDQFNLAYNAAQVHQRTVFFSPKEIGPLPDDKDHVVAYQDESNDAYFCSEPRRIEPLSYADLVFKARALFEQPQFQLLEVLSIHLRESIRDLVSPRMKQAEQTVESRVRLRLRSSSADFLKSPQTERTIEDIMIAREMTRVDLGLDLLITQPNR